MNTPPSASQPPAQEYFLETTDNGFQKRNAFFAWWKKFWQAFQYYARQVWPYVNRLISFITYETIKVIKGIVKIGLQQVGLFKD